MTPVDINSRLMPLTQCNQCRHYTNHQRNHGSSGSCLRLKMEVKGVDSDLSICPLPTLADLRDKDRDHCVNTGCQNNDKNYPRNCSKVQYHNCDVYWRAWRAKDDNTESKTSIKKQTRKDFKKEAKEELKELRAFISDINRRIDDLTKFTQYLSS